jgi:type IV pilus assembly protein PilA
MKKMLKQNKGFSLVELLVAILIMAVIAGTAITLFGGVLGSSRENADKETAENIKRAILTYMNMTNDTNLNCLGMSQATPWTDSKDFD